MASGAFSQPVRIAVAANAQYVIKVLQAGFKKRTGIETEVIIGSSGKLAAQIKNGAPYDLFLSADEELPLALYNEGFAAGRPEIYALGSLIVCSASMADLKNWQSALLTNKVNKIGLANPVLAPYGKAAEQVLRKYALWDKLSAKIVLGESIAQVNTYIANSLVSLGFTTEAFLHENPDAARLKWVRADNKAYEPIRQGMVILAYAKKGRYKNALKFFNYLRSPAAKAIFKKSGYRLP